METSDGSPPKPARCPGKLRSPMQRLPLTLALLRAGIGGRVQMTKALHQPLILTTIRSKTAFLPSYFRSSLSGPRSAPSLSTGALRRSSDAKRVDPFPEPVDRRRQSKSLVLDRRHHFSFRVQHFRPISTASHARLYPSHIHTFPSLGTSPAPLAHPRHFTRRARMRGASLHHNETLLFSYPHHSAASFMRLQTVGHIPVLESREATGGWRVTAAGVRFD